MTLYIFQNLKVIAATVASDPTKYSDAFLGKPNKEYCDWILNPDKWGGMRLLVFCFKVILSGMISTTGVLFKIKRVTSLVVLLVYLTDSLAV